MKSGVLPQPNEPDWARLLDAEAELAAQIAAEEAAARMRVASARAAAAAAVPDPRTLAMRLAASEQIALEGQQRELDRVAAEAEHAVRALSGAPDSLIDDLARRALDAVLTDALAAQRR